MSYDWNDLRYLVAVVDHRSAKRAAKVLNVSPTTCTRRIAALEAALGLDLFDRDDGRYFANANGLAVAEAARSFVIAAGELDSLLEQLRRDASATIRITCEEALHTTVVLPAVARFRESRPGIGVEIDCSVQSKNLAAGEADLALRPALELTDQTLIWRRLGEDPMAVFCGADYPDPPLGAEQIAGHPIVCHAAHAPQIRAAGLGGQIRAVTNTWEAVLRLIGKGDAIAPLPLTAAAGSAELRHCFDLPVTPSIWLVSRQDIRTRADLRQLSMCVAREYQKWRNAAAE